jgi:hypothetical protein
VATRYHFRTTCMMVATDSGIWTQQPVLGQIAQPRAVLIEHPEIAPAKYCVAPTHVGYDRGTAIRIGARGALKK